MEQTNNDCRFEILILINSPRQQHLLVGRKDSRLRYVLVHNFWRKLCNGSKKWRWFNQWIIWNLRVPSKEPMVQTLSCSTRELLQHWTKSSRIPASRKRSVWRKWMLTKKTVSFEEDRLHTWSTNTSGSQEPMILSRIMPIYSQSLFEMTMFRNSIRNGTDFLSMTKIPSDDILEGLYKLRIRESEKLKTVLELYNMEIHQKKAGPDYDRLKKMVKRSIEQDIRQKNFGARNWNYEKNAVVKNQRVKQREQRTLGDCWQWKANGQCSKGDNCSFWHDMNKRAKSAQPNLSPSSSTRQNVKNASRTRRPRGRSPSRKMARLPCKDYLKGTCTTPFCERWRPQECLLY